MLRKSATSILLLVLCQFLPSCDREPAGPKLEKAVIVIGEKTVTVEVARRPDEMARGLMFRRTLGEDEGMLFVYGSPRTLNFWMKNTMIPLSLAFIDEKGRIVQIEKMIPYDIRRRYRSKVHVQYALEMNRGWFEKNGVKIGDTVEIQITNDKRNPDNK